MKWYGLEAEYLLVNMLIDEVLKLGISGVSKEFYKFMVELVSGKCRSAAQATSEVAAIVAELQRRGVQLHPYASWSSEEPWAHVQWESVTGDSAYYQWVHTKACPAPIELHYVGFHLNQSDEEESEEQIVHACDWLRCLAPLFIFLSANSPLRNGAPAGCHSRRIVWYPNRYDVPFFENPHTFREWIRQEELVRRIFPGKARAWMPVCPRFEGDDVDARIVRKEMRAMDSGTNVPLEVVEGCFHLLDRICEHSYGRPLPATIVELEYNDKIVAWQGRTAKVRLNGKNYDLIDLARDWCSGIPQLEAVLDGTTASERVLSAL